MLRTSNWRRALPSACLLAFAACAPATPAATGGFTGATSSDTGFNSTSNGCVYSFLYSDFVVRRAPAPATTQVVSVTRTSTLNGPAHVAGAAVSLDVRGAAIGAVGAVGTLEVEFTGTTQSFPLAIAQGEASSSFTHTVTAPAVAGANAIRITATMPAAPEGSAQEVHVDSVDLSLGEAPFCATEAPSQ